MSQHHTNPFLTSRYLPWLLMALWVVPLWLFPHVPTQDGPDHLNNANILLELLRDPRSVYQTFFWIDLGTGTNTLTYVLLAGLLTVFSPWVAEQCLLSLYVVLFMACGLYALGKERRWAQVLLLPYVYGVFLNFGFYGFLFSVCAFLLYVGALERFLKGRHPRQALLLALAALFAYGSHVFAFVVICLYTACQCGWLVWLDWRSGRRALVASVERHVLVPVLSLVPAGLAYLFFRRPLAMDGLHFSRTVKMLGGLVTNASLYSHHVWELAVSGGVALTLWWLVAKRVRRDGVLEPRGALLVLAGLLSVLYCLTPDGLNDYYIGHRLNLFIYLAITLYLADMKLSAGHRRLLAGGFFLVALTLLGSNLWHWSVYNRQIAMYLSYADHMPQDATVLSVSLANKGVAPGGRDMPTRIAFMEHASGYLGVGRHVVTLDNYEATKNFSMVKFKPGLDPNAIIGLLDNAWYTPDRFAVPSYEAETGRRIDYVLLWGKGVHTFPNGVGDQLFSDLESFYDLVYTSPGGELNVYRRKA